MPCGSSGSCVSSMMLGIGRKNSSSLCALGDAPPTGRVPLVVFEGCFVWLLGGAIQGLLSCRVAGYVEDLLAEDACMSERTCIF